MKIHISALGLLLILSLAGCGRTEIPATSADAKPQNAAARFRISASIQDIMKHMVDPSADGLWESVSTTVTQAGTTEKRPQTAEEWQAVRSQAVTLMEATNLLVMDGRKVLNPGQIMEDEGVQGVLHSTEVQAKIAANHEQFVQFAHALHDVAEQMLKAIDAKNPQGMMDAGEGLDAVCESCHLTFWYPNQVIPEPPK